MNTEVLLFILSLLYGIPSFVLYVIILYQLIRPKYQKRFKNPFFRLCFLIGVVDCVGYLIFYIFFTLPIYSMFSFFFGSSLFFPTPFTTAVYFAAHLISNIQVFGNCFFTLNRFTAITVPTYHDCIWKRGLHIAIFITVLAAFMPIWQLSTTVVWYTPLQEEFPERGFAMTLDNFKYPDFSLSFHMFPSNVVACLLCLLMNLTSSIVLVCRGAQPVRRNAQLGLFLITCVIFLVQSTHSVLQFLFYNSMRVNDFKQVLRLYVFAPWINDLKYLSPPWVLIIISLSVRRSVFQSFQRIKVLGCNRVKPLNAK
ncbi:hypothetical protein QR680_007896 [Steinernema hermaphroditum]|uniref:Serpentine receptor class gamma n=1 Tax=Steinernema hermaphroditum TaxID=289476 RepID=A0AA39M743_9BILA|nr:hypothetical protein QR680_007896 [Steinernema hermaphroditum]